MNSNIEKIAPDLWAVNFQWVKNGWIKDIQIIPGGSTNPINLSAEGKIFLDKDSPAYTALKMIFTKIMKKTTEELQELVGKKELSEKMNTLEDWIINAAGFELRRRAIKQSYLHNQSKPTLKSKIRNMLRKAGDVSGYPQKLH